MAPKTRALDSGFPISIHITSDKVIVHCTSVFSPVNELSLWDHREDPVTSIGLSDA